MPFYFRGLGSLSVAKAQYNFASKGGAIGPISLGVRLPVNAIIVGGFVDVITSCTSGGANAGTMALNVQTANDLVAAIAISNAANQWNVGIRPIIPKANTPEATGIRLTAARDITATIAVNAFTAGKFNLFLYYAVSD